MTNCSAPPYGATEIVRPNHRRWRPIVARERECLYLGAPSWLPPPALTVRGHTTTPLVPALGPARSRSCFGSTSSCRPSSVSTISRTTALACHYAATHHKRHPGERLASYGSRWALLSPAAAAGVARALRPRAPHPKFGFGRWLVTHAAPGLGREVNGHSHRMFCSLP